MATQSQGSGLAGLMQRRCRRIKTRARHFNWEGRGCEALEAQRGSIYRAAAGARGKLQVDASPEQGKRPSGRWRRGRSERGAGLAAVKDLVLGAWSLRDSAVNGAVSRAGESRSECRVTGPGRAWNAGASCLSSGLEGHGLAGREERWRAELAGIRVRRRMSSEKTVALWHNVAHGPQTAKVRQRGRQEPAPCHSTRYLADGGRGELLELAGAPRAALPVLCVVWRGLWGVAVWYRGLSPDVYTRVEVAQLRSGDDNTINSTRRYHGQRSATRGR